MTWITVEKCDGGFHYKIGQLVIGRSRWAKRQGELKLLIYYLEPAEAKFGCAAVSLHKNTFTPQEALQFFVDKTQGELK